MIPYGRQFIDEDDIQAVVEVLRSDYLTTGPKVREFEQKFSQKVGAKYAVAVANGTAALHVACLAAGLSKGDEIITSPMTFAASANCALYCGAKPQFVDINDTGLIDFTKIEEKINSKTKILIPVDYSGIPCDLEEIYAIAKKHDLLVIEDACHALGASYKESIIGDCKYADMTVFSFHPVKHITSGEGGMITTNDSELYSRLQLFRTHGITKDSAFMSSKDEGAWYYEMIALGYNYRITDFQCALGLSQLQKLDRFVKRRQEIAQKYYRAFIDEENFTTIEIPQNRTSSFHLFPILLKTPFIDKKKEIFQQLRDAGLWVQVHYIPVHLSPYYQSLGYQSKICPNSKLFYDAEISIPMYPAMSDEDVNQVILLLQKIIF